MKEAFVSCFASDLELFVMKKQEAGFHYGSQVHILRQFDGFCAGQEISIPEVTRELVEAWLSSFKNCCAGYNVRKGICDKTVQPVPSR